MHVGASPAAAASSRGVRWSSSRKSTQSGCRWRYHATERLSWRRTDSWIDAQLGASGTTGRASSADDEATMALAAIIEVVRLFAVVGLGGGESGGYKEEVFVQRRGRLGRRKNGGLWQGKDEVGQPRKT